jgi:multiple sugar transport system substrate-binding protein
LSEPEKKSRRNFLKYGAGVVAVGVVAAVGYGAYQMSQAPPTPPPTTSAMTTAPPATTTVAPPPTTMAKPWEGQSLHAAMIDVPGAKQIEALAPNFTKEYNIAFSDEWYSEEALREKTLVDFMADTKAFDNVMTGSDFLTTFASGKEIEPIDHYINDPSIAEPDKLALDDFEPIFLGMGQYNGVQYELPHYGESTFLFWRTDLYEQYGLSQPKTTDELYHNAEAIFTGSKGKVYGIVLRGRRGQGLNVYTWTPFMRAFGGRFFKDYPKDFTPTLNTPEVLAATKFYADILQKFGPPGVASYTWAEVIVELQKGTAGQCEDATSLFHQVYRNPNSKYPENWMTMPGIPCAPGYSVDKEKPMDIYTWNWAINQDIDDKRKQAAFKWLQWATGKPTTTALYTGQGLPSPYLFRGAITRKSVAAVPAIQAEKDVWVDSFFKSVDAADPDVRPRIPEWPNIGDICGLYLQDTISGGSKPEFAVARMQQEVEAIVKAAKYPPYG